MKDFRELQVWHKAHAMTLEIYRVAAKFPVEQRYGLTSQLRRCASSIPSNIAEGCGAGSDADFARFLQIAMRLSLRAGISPTVESGPRPDQLSSPPQWGEQDHGNQAYVVVPTPELKAES